MTARLQPPSREEIRALEPFEGIPGDRIHQPRSAESLAFARTELLAARHVGLDTESKPSFVAGAEHTGPHIVQLATLEHAFIFDAGHPGCVALVAELLRAESLVKVGFGLGGDRALLLRKLGAEVRPTVELSSLVRGLGYRQPLGLQAAVAVVLARYIHRPKKLTTSNWSRMPLSTRQLHYAANDAYASLCVFHALGHDHTASGA